MRSQLGARMVFRRVHHRLFLALAAAGLATGVQASDEGLYFSELPIVASVSRLPQRLADAPTSVTVIDREMIRASGFRNLNDVFRLVPGFQTFPNNTEAARVTYHGLSDGDYSSRVQVLIDGRSMLSPLFGSGVNWATLPVAMEDIERIEVVRGTNAVSYGGNAFLGVINIITVDPALTRGVSVSASHGNQNVRDYSLRAGGRLGDVGDLRFTYRSQNDDGLANNWDWIDSFGSRLLDLRADFALSDRDTFQISAGHAIGVTEAGRRILGAPPVVNDNPLRTLKQTHAYLQTVWRRVLAADSELQVRYAYIAEESDDGFVVRLPTLAPITINQSGDEGFRHEVEATHSLRVNPVARVVYGASWRADAMRSEWMLRNQGTVRRDVGRLFGNLEWQPSRWLTTNIGVSGESDSLGGEHLSPRLSASFHVTPQNTLRLGWSQAYHTGSILNYRGWEETPIPNAGPFAAFYEFRYRGNPNMPAERLDTLEVGYLGDWRSLRTSLDIRLFHEKVSGRLMRIDLGDGNRTIPSSTVPIQDVTITGLEYQFKTQPFESTRLVLNQTFARIVSEFLPSAVTAGSTLANSFKAGDIDNFTENSMPSRSTSAMWIQRLPLGLEFSLLGFWQQGMKWSTNTTALKYHRVDARLAYPFRAGPLGGEVAFTVQSLNGSHNEYKWPTGGNPDGRTVDRRQWLSLRLDY